MLKGREMGRFQTGPHRDQPVCPWPVKLVDTLQSLSVTKIGQPLATAVEATAAAEPAPLPERRDPRRTPRQPAG
ncbi:hypothetical protein LNQ52_06530 [Klebsiella pneumoniae subsp. pneumoniae]|nr:hypothetical protein [Klebsiella pneumoniae subsp. pneumoniae]